MLPTGTGYAGSLLRSTTWFWMRQWWPRHGELLAARGITPQNVTVVVGEQMGSGILVELTDGGNNEAHAIRVGGTSVRGDGYTVNCLPQELYPEVPERPGITVRFDGHSP